MFYKLVNSYKNNVTLIAIEERILSFFFMIEKQFSISIEKLNDIYRKNFIINCIVNCSIKVLLHFCI